ncbi:MAG: WYL domain-containing protein, partial [Pseudobdellovibrionaceae bacterium]
ATAEGIAHRPGPRPKSDPVIVGALRHAIKAMKQMRLHYRGRGSGVLSRQRVSPLGILYGSRNYLLAYNHNQQVGGIRSFALTNIERVEVLDQVAHRPAEFSDLKSYTADWFGVFEEKPVDVTLRFTRRASSDAKNFLFHPNQSTRDLENGRLEVRFRAGGLKEIAWHIFTWGADVKVITPRKLSQMIPH